MGGTGCGETGSCSGGQGHARWNFNPIFCWWVGLRPNYGRGNGSIGNLLQTDLFKHATVPRTVVVNVPDPHGRPLWTHAFTGDSWTLTGKSGSISCGVSSPLSWVLVCTGFVCALQESVSPVLWKFHNQIPLASKVKFPGVLGPFAGSPGWGLCCGPYNFCNSVRTSLALLP